MAGMVSGTMSRAAFTSSDSRRAIGRSRRRPCWFADLTRKEEVDMKRFMYFSSSVLCLSIAVFLGFYIGSHSAQAQAPEPINGYRIWRDQGSPYISIL